MKIHRFGDIMSFIAKRIKFSLARSSDEKAFLFSFSTWKTYMDLWVPGKTIVHCGFKVKEYRFYKDIAPKILDNPKNEVYVWSYNCPEYLEEFCKENRIKFTRVEDGFLRSISLGAQRVPPISMCLENRGLYFDATRKSTLEKIALTHDFVMDSQLESRSRAAMRLFLQSNLSKYNGGDDSLTANDIYGVKTKKRILVIGQVEGDMSIKLGCAEHLTNNDAVRIAARENPDAEIIYRPHPEVMAGFRKDKQVSNPQDVSDIATISTERIPLAKAFDTIDRVYTITSLSGFEALLRGIPVTCLGAPFYSNWGLTDDRQNVPRRTRNLTIEQLFACAYLLYPTYRNPMSGEEITFEEAVRLLLDMKTASSTQQDDAVKNTLVPRSNAFTVEDRSAIQST